MLSTRQRARLADNRSARIGAALVGLLVLFAVVGPAVAPHSPFESDFAKGVARNTGLPVGPCAAFPFGADRIFRDVFARLAWGGRMSLTIALSATLLASLVGTIVGMIAGFYEGRRAALPWTALAGAAIGVGAALLGRPVVGLAVFTLGLGAAVFGQFAGPRIDVDGWLMRFVDVMLAFPFLLLVMAIGASVEQTTAVTIFVTLGLTGWLGTARILRAKTMQVRSLEYVVAARALGQSTARVMLKHVLPGIAGPLVVVSTMQVAQMIVADSVLSYLGVGIAPPAPTWGRMLFEGQDYYASAPWLVLGPAAAILLAVWGFNLLGEGLRDALDPNEA